MGKRKYLPETQEQIPPTKWSTRQLENANSAYKGFIKWLGMAEWAANGSDLAVTVRSMPLDMVDPDYAKKLRVETWAMCLRNLKYYASKAQWYVTIPDAETSRMRAVIYQLDEFLNS